MRIEVPEDIVVRAQANATELRLALAVQLYADNRIDHADACRLAGISTAELNRELATRALSIQQYPSRPRCGIRRTA